MEFLGFSVAVGWVYWSGRPMYYCNVLIIQKLNFFIAATAKIDFMDIAVHNRLSGYTIASSHTMYPYPLNYPGAS